MSLGNAEGKVIARKTLLAFDSNNNLFLLENDGNPEGNRIQKFSSEMDFLYSFGNVGPNSSSKLNILSLCKFDAVGNLYTSTERNIQLFNQNAQLIRTFGGIGDSDVFNNTIIDFAFDSRGDLYVITAQEIGTVHQFSPSGDYVSSFLKYPLIPTEPHFYADKILFDKSDNMYLMQNNRCLKYDAQKNLVADFTFKFEKSPNGFTYPTQDVAIDALGLFNLIQNSYLYKFDQRGELIAKFEVLSPRQSFHTDKETLALDDLGFIYVTDMQTIRKFDQSGSLVTIISDNYTLPVIPWNIELSVSPDGAVIKSVIKDIQFFHNIKVFEHKEGIPIINRISGNFFADTNQNCIQENEQGLEGIIVEAQPGPYYGVTDINGNYKIAVEPGTYTVNTVIKQKTGRTIIPSCPPSGQVDNIEVTTLGATAININFGNQVTLSPYLAVSVSSDRRRRCFESTTKLTYSNTGFAPANNAKVYLQLPAQVELLSADKPYTRLPNGTYVFDAGTVAAGQTSVITIQDKVVCGDESIRGMTVCTRVWITPGNQSPTAPPAPVISITGTCNPETGKVRFVIKNTGQVDMEESEQFRKYINGLLSTVEDYRLAAGDSLVLWVPAGGRTVRLEADQPDGNGDNTMTSTTVEACSTVATRTAFSTGFVNVLPTDDEEAEVAEECLPIIDSFDPNDKLVLPFGRTEENFTPTGVALKYKIRFQNTGTDVAYRVVVVDTLSEHLDLSTLQIGSASHTYRYELSGKGKPVLTWTFDNIMLPDSTTNELGSHGYIQFSIKPKAELTEKTAVENYADIFFDYNSPVRTNITVNRIYDMPLVINEAVRMDLEQIIATPGIDSFSPAAGKYGTAVTISGKNFSATAANNKVYFNGILAPVVSASETELHVLVPTNATTGALKVITPDGAATTTDAFEVYQPPVLSSFSPVEGVVGSAVTLQGEHLEPALLHQVTLGGLSCEIISNTDQGLVVSVPAEALTSWFEIITKGGETRSSSAYVVWQQPSISSLSKTSDAVGAIINISGEHFAPTADRNKVIFGQAAAQVLQARPDQLTVKVPQGAASGQITVETPGGKAISSILFEVIPAPAFISMVPSRGSVGTEVEITGLHFGMMGLQDEISFNGEKAQVLEASNTTYKVRVPRGATSGKISIAGAGGETLSTDDFIVEALTPAQAIVVYPNPSTGHFTISFLHADFDVQAVQVYDTIGKLLHTVPVATPRPEKLEMNLGFAKAGLYMLQIKTDRGMVTKKLNIFY